MPIALGYKKEMSRHFTAGGAAIPVTFLDIPVATVAQVKTRENDGYTALQIGVGEVKNKSKSKVKKPYSALREFRGSEGVFASLELGKTVEVDQFTPGMKVHVIGISKGRGYAGVVKRHHFRGHPVGHGHKDAERAPGSIGHAGVQHVFTGLRMAGRMGTDRVTVKNLEVIEVMPRLH